jgi:hypothetical protein
VSICLLLAIIRACCVPAVLATIRAWLLPVPVNQSACCLTLAARTLSGPRGTPCCRGCGSSSSFTSSRSRSRRTCRGCSRRWGGRAWLGWVPFWLGIWLAAGVNVAGCLCQCGWLLGSMWLAACVNVAGCLALFGGWPFGSVWWLAVWLCLVDGSAWIGGVAGCFGSVVWMAVLARWCGWLAGCLCQCGWPFGSVWWLAVWLCLVDGSVWLGGVAGCFGSVVWMACWLPCCFGSVWMAACLNVAGRLARWCERPFGLLAALLCGCLPGCSSQCGWLAVFLQFGSGCVWLGVAALTVWWLRLPFSGIGWMTTIFLLCLADPIFLKKKKN